MLFDVDALTAFLIELEAEQIDLHLHVVGDRATRVALDAVVRARDNNGGPLSIEVTLSHLETVHPDDIERFDDLDVHANFTPHWFGGTVFGRAGTLNLGPERANRSQMVGSFVDAGANVTLSSDVVSSGEAYRADPFIGLEMSVTRREFGADDSAPVLSSEAEQISVEAALSAYTINGAAQLGQSDQIGSLKAGKLADFVILDANPTEVAVSDIHEINPIAVVIGGRLVSGSLSAEELQ